jgi:succinate dehydrogenase/fumarate reductase cytochrome b subunit
MANPTETASNTHRLTGLISASVLVTGLLLMAFVSGASESSARTSATSSATSSAPTVAVHAVH